MIEYVSEIFLSEVSANRTLIDDNTAPAMIIMDNSKGQVTDNAIELLQASNVHACLLPANTTDRLQPMDVSVNKPFKAYEIGALWFVEAANYISDTPSLIVNGFHHLEIAAALMMLMDIYMSLLMSLLKMLKITTPLMKTKMMIPQ
uniref:DDE-1 domain-containing protein n=1 Tax=Amphimedon queenslandica TaxID=400682 RepID=A0A1X7UT15_AMPQE